MISLNQISLQRGGKILLEKASLKLHAGQRMAVVGVNGCGKSSLFQLLLGKLEQDAGEVEIPPQLRIAHMAQEIEQVDRGARDYVIDGFTRLRELEAQQASAEARGDNDALAHIHAELDSFDAYNIHYRAESIMLGLGFKPEDYERPVAAFSGGWRIRLNLARTLLNPSDVMLLDEPTNHLDIEAIRWLEQWLRQYPGSVLLISHDRDFIDAVVSHIAHFEDQQIHIYSGSYSDFERQRAEKLSQQQSLFDKQQQRRAHLQSFIDRFKAKATKAKQAQSRIKALEKMQLVAAVREKSAYQFRIPEADKTGSPLVNWFDAAVGYPGKAVVEHCTFSILPGSRIGLLGPNGAGKSTLIKSIAGTQPVLSGEVVCSEHLRIGYFAQHQLEALDPEASPILHLQRLSPQTREQEIRDFLGGYRIHGDMATGNIRNFSGGEKARLALAIIAWQKPNLLLLDEPTNHLDIEMREALTEALQAFNGAVLLVSHDRYMLRHCVDEFWLVNGGSLQPFAGDLDDYYDFVQQQGNAPVPLKENGDKGNKKQNRQEAAARRQALAPIQKQIKQLEQKMEKLQQCLDKVREELSSEDIYLPQNKDRLQTLLREEGELKPQLEAQEEAWMEQQMLLEEAQAQ